MQVQPSISVEMVFCQHLSSRIRGDAAEFHVSSYQAVTTRIGGCTDWATQRSFEPRGAVEL